MGIFAVSIGKEVQLRGGGIGQVFPTVGKLATVLYWNIFYLAGFLLLFLLIFGGISIIIGAGSGESGRVEKGKKAINAAVAGFLIIFTSWFIVQIVEVLTGVAITH